MPIVYVVSLDFLPLPYASADSLHFPRPHTLAPLKWNAIVFMYMYIYSVQSLEKILHSRLI